MDFVLTTSPASLTSDKRIYKTFFAFLIVKTLKVLEKKITKQLRKILERLKESLFCER